MLSLKELRHAKLRFGLIAVAVGLVVSLTMLMSAMSEGLMTGMTGAKGSLEADALVFQDGSQLALERSLLTPDDVRRVAETEGVAGSYAVGHAMISVTPETSPGGPDEVELLDARLFGLGGRWDQLPAVEGEAGMPGPGEAIVDVTARVDGIDLGDTVVVTPGDRRLTVVGFTEDRRYIMAPSFYVDMDTWREIYLATTVGPEKAGADGGAESIDLSGAATVVAVDLTEGVGASELAERLPGYDVATPADAALAGNGMSVMVLATDGIQWVSLVIAALFIGVFFYITTLHKTGQMAAMKALGASNGYLYRQLLLQIAVVVSAAAVLGMLLSLGAGASMPPTMAFDPQPLGWGLSLLAVYLMAFLGSLFSLRSILAVDPATALDRAEH